VPGVGEVGILGVVDGVDEPLAALPEERGALPDVILCEELDDGGLADGVVVGEEHAGGLGAGEVFIFVRGAGFEDADEVLEGALARGDGLRGADGVGDMAFEWDVALLRFVGDGEVGLARNAGLHLDEVGSALLQHGDGGASIRGGRDGDGCFVVGLGAVEHGAGDDHARAGDAMGGDLVASVQDGVEVAAHIAYAGDAVGEEEREDEVGAVGGGAAEVDVGVHVPQTGDEVLTGGVDDLAGGRRARGARDRVDAIVVDHDGAIRLGLSGDGIDDGDVRDGKGLRTRGG